MFAGTHASVSSFTIDLDRADRARNLLNLTAQRAEGQRDVIIGHARDLGCRREAQELAFGIIGGCGRTKANRGLVDLVATREKS